jgi:hypothetical protein
MEKVMPRVEDRTQEAIDDSSIGPGEHVERVRKAKPAKQLTPTLQATLDAWNHRADKTLPNVSKVLAYGFRYIKPSQHSNLIRLIKGSKLRLCRIEGKPPEGSEAKRQSPYGDRYFILRETCPSEVSDGTIAGRGKR